jgi:outer membrane protein OmpA-like peptidoglycan-associated protein
MKAKNLFFGLLSVMALTKIAYADDINFGKQTPSTNQVIDAFSPAKARPDDAGYEVGGKSRSIDMSNLEATPKANKQKIKKSIHTAVQTNTDVALSMQINFGYNSSELTAAAQQQLKPVGEAMASKKLQNLNFMVEGHTDAIGSYAYNKMLSEERAASVKQFLVDMFHIEPYRINVIGKGKSDLLDRKNPGSEVNRRVRIIARQ